MKLRPSPSFFVAVLALVLAGAGAGYAAGQITSGQIKDNTVQSKDIKNRTIVAKDVKKGSLGSGVLNRSCKSTTVKVFGKCVDKVASGPTNNSWIEAVNACNARGGELPTLGELRFIATNVPGITWANGQANQYEFTSTTTTVAPITPMAMDQSYNPFDDASAQSFWYRCLIAP